MTYISTGTTYRVFDESLKTYDTLPVGTYRVSFSDMSGFFLTKIEDIGPGTEKVYGNHNERIDRILRSYNSFTRSLGVLLSGDKGMGKSLMVRLIAERVRNELEMPVILVDKDYDGISRFLDSLDEAFIIFDEFEKVFPAGREENRQNQFLGLFDGISTTKRIYMVTVNSLNNLSDYFVNRPGRFHYHIRFDYPNAASIREYLTDQVPNISTKNLDDAVLLSHSVNLNYDHLRALAFELSLGSDFRDIIGDLNIKRVEELRYLVQATFTNGDVITSIEYLDLNGTERERFYMYHQEGQINFSFSPEDLDVTENGIDIPLAKVQAKTDIENLGKLSGFSVSLMGQKSINF